MRCPLSCPSCVPTVAVLCRTVNAAGCKAREEAIEAAWPLLERVKTALPRRDAERHLPALEALRGWLDRNRDV